MSKGDNPRPLSIPSEEFEERWEQTFGTDSDKCPETGTLGTTYWPCSGCGELINGRIARTHDCGGEDE